MRGALTVKGLTKEIELAHTLLSSRLSFHSANEELTPARSNFLIKTIKCCLKCEKLVLMICHFLFSTVYRHISSLFYAKVLMTALITLTLMTLLTLTALITLMLSLSIFSQPT